MSEALAEAVLIAKKERKRAEESEKKLEIAELGRLKALGGQGLAEESLIGAKNKHDRTEKKLKRARADNRALRVQIRDLQNEMKLPPESLPVEVIAFVSGDGHSVIINCTGTAQKLKVLREIVKAAIHHKHIDPDNTEHYDVKALLESGTPNELNTLLSDSDIPQCGMSREGFTPVGVNDGWPLEWGFDD